MYVHVFNAPPTLNFILHRGAARYTAPCNKKKLMNSLDTSPRVRIRYFIVGVNTLVDREKVLIRMGGGGVTDPKKGDDGKGHAGNTSTVGGFGFDVGERRRDAVCAALSLACLKLL